MADAKIATEAGFYAGQFRKAGQGYVDDSVSLADMTKEQLLAQAQKRGLSVKPSDTKADLVAALSPAS